MMPLGMGNQGMSLPGMGGGYGQPGAGGGFQQVITQTTISYSQGGSPQAGTQNNNGTSGYPPGSAMGNFINTLNMQVASASNGLQGMGQNGMQQGGYQQPGMYFPQQQNGLQPGMSNATPGYSPSMNDFMSNINRQVGLATGGSNPIQWAQGLMAQAQQRKLAKQEEKEQADMMKMMMQMIGKITGKLKSGKSDQDDSDD